MRQDSRAQRSAQMRTPLAPIHAAAAEGAFQALQSAQFDAAAGKKVAALARELERAAAPGEQSRRQPAPREVYRQAPAQMVVAGAGMAHRLVPGARAGAQMAGARR